MLFSSIPFLYYFLPVVLLLYFAVPKKCKNGVLLAASLFFYAWGEPKNVLFMIVSILAGYGCGLLIEKYRSRQGLAKLFLTLSVVICLGMLAYFKYVDFFIDNFNAVTGLSVPLLRIALPIGISFYTFQILSYTVDVYRGDVPAQRNLVTLATYIALFPQLIAGPIVRYSTVAAQLEQRTHTADKAAEGFRRFTLGLAKKILIANALGELCDIFRASDDKSVLFYWLYIVAYSIHIYFDFSGYSDMAIGLGKIFGLDFLENFHYPFISRSITEFWRRWHMSLGSWFRDYLYIPLGGNRVSTAGWLRNIFIVWLLTGFWHGASWNFILWGLYFAVFLVLEKFWLGKYLKKFRLASHIYVLLVAAISFAVFNAADMPQAASDIAGLFGAGDLPLVSKEALYYLRSYAVILLLGIVGSTPLPKKLVLAMAQNKTGSKVLTVLEPLVLAVLLVVMTAFLVDGSFNPFLYFRF